MYEAVIIGLAIAGFLLSLYAAKLSYAVNRNEAYQPWCDISDRVSCSKAVKSPYAHLFFIPNYLIGLVFYALLIAAAMLNYWDIVFILSLLSCAASIFFAFILFFKVRTLCLLCTTLYLINFLLLWCSYYQR